MANVAEKKNKYIKEFLNDFEGGSITCVFSLLIKVGLVEYNTSTMAICEYRVLQGFGCLVFLKALPANNDFVNISQLTITIETTLNPMTKSFCLKQKKSVLERNFLKQNIDL